MRDAILGELSEDKEGYLKGSLPYEGRQVVLSLRNKGKPWEPCLVLARSMVAALSEIDRKGKAAAADKLLRVYNTNWREYSEADGQGGFVDVSNPEIGEEAFKAAIRLVDVAILGDRMTDLWYEAGDLFWGHSINVTALHGPAFRAPHVSLFG